jgi:deazaflavin-dependent oxidoreductase (nitroreductase family)
MSLADLSGEPYCYLTTTGRVTGKPHEIEIWFAVSGDTVYLMNGNSKFKAGHADWLRNLRKQPRVSLRIKDRTFEAPTRMVTDGDEDALARRLLLAKYATPARPLTEWGLNAVPVAIDLIASAR